MTTNVELCNMLSVIIKTHEDHNVLDKCVSCVKDQSYDDLQIVIMDTASADVSYVKKYEGEAGFKVIIEEKDLGFCVGNNIAAQTVIEESEYIMFLNPDAFLESSFISNAIQLLEKDESHQIGILSGKLLWYDLKEQRKTQIIDSAGIFQTWYGRWYNRGMGQRDCGQYETTSTGESVPAVCGALMLCRTEALKAAQLAPGEYFNSSFFMYKDDIDLSVRVCRTGYAVYYNSHLRAWHCRGWQRKNRSRMPKKLRVCAAKNEIEINRELSLLKHSFSLAKLALVKMGF